MSGQAKAPLMLPERIWGHRAWGLLRAADEPARRPIIIANPPRDSEFTQRIQQGLMAGARRPEELQSVLRTRYPGAVVRRRDLADERTEVWYVYRDGHWIGSEQDVGR